jgi:HEPN domain-containing protein
MTEQEQKLEAAIKELLEQEYPESATAAEPREELAVRKLLVLHLDEHPQGEELLAMAQDMADDHLLSLISKNHQPEDLLARDARTAAEEVFLTLEQYRTV